MKETSLGAPGHLTEGWADVGLKDEKLVRRLGSTQISSGQTATDAAGSVGQMEIRRVSLMALTLAPKGRDSSDRLSHFIALCFEHKETGQIKQEKREWQG